MTAGGSYPVSHSELIFTGKVVSLRRDTVGLPGGTKAVREVVEHPGAVGVLALDGQQRVVLVNQYRHPVAAHLDELPAGLLDHAGESALVAAQRELAEEAGLRAREWHLLVDLLPSPGMSAEAIRVFLARELSPAELAGFVAVDEEANMTVHRVPLAEAVQQIFAGQIRNASAVAAILAAAVGASQGWSSLRPADTPWADRPDRSS